MPIKIWMSFDESPTFSKKDRTMFYVVPADGNREHKMIHEAYVEADTIDQARALMVAKIDKWRDHYKHMEDLENLSKEKTARLSKEAVKDRSTTSIRISEDPGGKSTPPVC